MWTVFSRVYSRQTQWLCLGNVKSENDECRGGDGGGGGGEARDIPQFSLNAVRKF